MTNNNHFAIASLFLFGSSLMAQTHTVNVTDRRPLLAALDQIERTLEKPVNYEDVPCEHVDDLEPVLDPRIRASINGRPARLPKNGSVNLTFGSVASESQKLLVLNDLLNAYRRSYRSGDFRVELANDMYYVVATKTKGIDGKQRDVASPMLARITIPYAKRKVVDTIELIVTELSKASGVRVLVGNVPFGHGIETINFGVDRETGRNALARLLSQGRPVSYKLIFDTLINSYMLNLKVASRPSPINGTAAPSTEAPPVSSRRKWLDPVGQPAKP